MHVQHKTTSRLQLGEWFCEMCLKFPLAEKCKVFSYETPFINFEIKASVSSLIQINFSFREEIAPAAIS